MPCTVDPPFLMMPEKYGISIYPYIYISTADIAYLSQSILLITISILNLSRKHLESIACRLTKYEWSVTFTLENKTKCEDNGSALNHKTGWAGCNWCCLLLVVQGKSSSVSLAPSLIPLRSSPLLKTITIDANYNFTYVKFEHSFPCSFCVIAKNVCIN